MCNQIGFFAGNVIMVLISGQAEPEIMRNRDKPSMGVTEFCIRGVTLCKAA